MALAVPAPAAGDRSTGSGPGRGLRPGTATPVPAAGRDDPAGALSLDELLAPVVESYLGRYPDADTGLIERAAAAAMVAHEGQFRRSGEPYVTHPVAVAHIVADLGLDAQTVAAALLHDAVEDTGTTVEMLEEDFGPEVAQIVDGVTKLDRLQFDSKEAQQAATVRKMLVAMASDWRVLIIKLADRLHNMRTLSVMPEWKQRRTAQETLDIYAPLAHRLGIQEIRWQLEDLAFATLHPKRYAEIEQMVASRAPLRDEYLARVLVAVRDRLTGSGISAEVTGRPKHLWSIYEKMVVRGKEFDELYDLVGLRVIVESEKDCWAALGSIHAIWPPVQGRFKDYINSPKFNLYQSLHTTVIGLDGNPIEVQVRTHDMHRRAEYGIAAHWNYKEAGGAERTSGTKGAKGRLGSGRFRGRDAKGARAKAADTELDVGEVDRALQERARAKGGRGTNSTTAELEWMQRIVDFQNETTDPIEFLAALKLDLEQDEVYVFTPKGKVLALPANATPVDFAYAIHTEVGHRCIGAKVNGRLVPLDTALTSADTVEIFTSRAPTAGPSRDWLNIVASSRARTKIRQWFSRERREDALEVGRDDLIKELRREGLPVQKLAADDALDELAASMNYADLDALHVAIGESRVSARSVVQRLVRELHGGTLEEQLPVTARQQRTVARPGHATSVGVYVEGLDDLMVRLSRCCTPVPGDEIVGFVTRGRGVSVHRADCANAASLASRSRERLIEVEWDHRSSGVFVATLEVVAIDRSRLLADVTKVVSEHHLNIVGANTQTDADRISRMRFDVELADPTHLESVLSSIRHLDAVYDAYRILPGEEELSPGMADEPVVARAPSGTHDVLAPDSDRWEVVLAAFAGQVERAGYGLALTPMFEDVRVFRRGIGEGSDVVGKEMYEFEDRGGRRVALRPEGTAPMVRAWVQHRPPLPWKAWYATPAFRYERPQAGRYRQHHQLGVEALGPADADLDVEVVALADGFFRSVGLRGFACRLNSMGDGVCRPGYLAALTDFVAARRGELCDEHAERFAANPLRVLDCKKPGCVAVTAEAPRITDHLCDPCRHHFARVRAGLDALGVPYELDHRLVRGFDYYTRTTFEFSSAALDAAQNGIGGGGRYDGLVELLGGPPTPGIGFGIGIERLLLACDAEGVLPVSPRLPDAFVVDVAGGEAARDLTAALRRAGLAADRAFDGRSMKSQLKAADRSGARVALIIGPDEAAAGTVTVRPLRAAAAPPAGDREGDAGLAQWSVPRSAAVRSVEGLVAGETIPTEGDTE